MRYCRRLWRWQRQYRRRHRLCRHSRCATRRAASAARHFGNEPTVPLGPLYPLLRFLGFYEAKVIYSARFTAAFLPPSSLCPSPQAGPPTEYRPAKDFTSRTRPFLSHPLVARCTSFARTIIDLRRALREMASMKCRGEVLINAHPE